MGLIAPELFVIIDMFWDTEVYYRKEIRMARFYPLFSGSSGNYDVPTFTEKDS